MDVNDIASVNSREHLVELILQLVEDLTVNQDAWESIDLKDFLSAMAAWLADSEGYCDRLGLDQSSLSVWRLMADALMGARVYE